MSSNIGIPGKLLRRNLRNAFKTHLFISRCAHISQHPDTQLHLGPFTPPSTVSIETVTMATEFVPTNTPIKERQQPGVTVATRVVLDAERTDDRKNSQRLKLEL